MATVNWLDYLSGAIGIGVVLWILFTLLIGFRRIPSDLEVPAPKRIVESQRDAWCRSMGITDVARVNSEMVCHTMKDGKQRWGRSYLVSGHGSFLAYDDFFTDGS
jgi:hypothetical protein